MSRTIAPAPVRRAITVKAAPAKAFDVFTAGMGRWWLKTHSINGAPLAEVIVEPRAGGRWFERGEDGSECTWGHVIAWEPPTRVLLAWQIDGAFRFDPEFITEVEVRFIPDGTGTRVELEHRNLERFGDQANAARATFESPNGWSGLLTVFAAEADRGASTIHLQGEHHD